MVGEAGLHVDSGGGGGREGGAAQSPPFLLLLLFLVGQTRAEGVLCPRLTTRALFCRSVLCSAWISLLGPRGGLRLVSVGKAFPLFPCCRRRRCRRTDTHPQHTKKRLVPLLLGSRNAGHIHQSNGPVLPPFETLNYQKKQRTAADAWRFMCGALMRELRCAVRSRARRTARHCMMTVRAHCVGPLRASLPLGDTFPFRSHHSILDAACLSFVRACLAVPTYSPSPLGGGGGPPPCTAACCSWRALPASSFPLLPSPFSLSSLPWRRKSLRDRAACASLPGQRCAVPIFYTCDKNSWAKSCTTTT